MSTEQEFSTKKFDKQDFNQFKPLILIFMILTAINAILYYFVPLLSVILYGIATFLLVIGMFLVSRKRNQEKYAFAVGSFFGVGVLLLLIGAIYITIYPYHFTAGTSLATLETNVGHHIIGEDVPAVFSGLFMAIAGYLFDEWLNDNMNEEKPFKAFTWFGVIFFAGQILNFLGLEMLQGTIVQSLWQTAGSSTAAIGTSSALIFIGTIIMVISFAVEIFVAYKVWQKMGASASTA